jgi:hypothetical protein
MKCDKKFGKDPLLCYIEVMKIERNKMFDCLVSQAILLKRRADEAFEDYISAADEIATFSKVHKGDDCWFRFHEDGRWHKCTVRTVRWTAQNGFEYYVMGFNGTIQENPHTVYNEDNIKKA